MNVLRHETQGNKKTNSYYIQKTDMTKNNTWEFYNNQKDINIEQK